MLDAPVSGGERGAIDAALSIMVGGTDEAFRRAAPVFEALGKNIVHVGPSGAGQVAKACNQLVVAATIEAVAEALLLAERSGVDAAKVREALLGGFAGSKILEVHGQRMLDRSFSPGFRIRLHRKDARIVEEAAAATDTPIPVICGRRRAAATGGRRGRRRAGSQRSVRRAGAPDVLMTDRLYSTDAYLDQCDARVVAATPAGVVLDRTVAYARGGGQPGDTGVLTTDAGELVIVDTFVDRESGELIHALAEGSAPPDDRRAGSRRDRRLPAPHDHADAHGAARPQRHRLHVVRREGDRRQHGRRRNRRMDFELDAMSQEFGREVEERLNAALAEAHAVTVLFLPRAEALADPDSDPHRRRT